MARFLAEKWAAVYRNGYAIVPIAPGTKAPSIDKWQNTKATPQLINGMLANGHSHDDMGILTRDTPCVDIDILNPEVAREMRQWVQDNIGEGLVRFGRRPKVALLFRTETPFRKIASKAYLDEQGRTNKVEILGVGQQVVAFAIHMETGRPYEWPIADGSPEFVRAADLPPITEKDGRAIVAHFHEIAEARGWRVKTPSPNKLAQHNDELADWGIGSEHLGWSDHELRSHVMAVPNDDADEDDWFKMIAEIHHQSGGSEAGREIAREWSDLSTKHKDKRFDYRWSHFNEEYTGDLKTARYILYLEQLESLDLNLFRFKNWVKRDIPPLDPLLGAILHTTIRALLIGPTGLGKTNFTMAKAYAVSRGDDFLHWKGSGKPRRVLIVDGEMSRRLMQRRLRDLARRNAGISETLFVLCREDFEHMPPLNTKDGQRFINRVVEKLGGIDLVILDNIQALNIGDLTDPASWELVLPWIRDLTRREIGQEWIHHTGLVETHGYGDKTREWQLDQVALMERVDEFPYADIAFRLRFTKARERDPDNRADFDPVIITLSDDRWEAEPAPVTVAPKREKPQFTPSQQGALLILDELIAEQVNTETKWRDACIDDDQRRVSQSDDRNNRKSVFNKARRELYQLGAIKFEDGKVRRKDEYFDD